MIRHALAPLLLLVAAAGSGAAASAPPRPTTYERVESYLSEHRERAGVPGLAWAVLDSDGVLDRGALGRDGDGRPVGPHTTFLVGSIAKTFTAVAVLRLVEAGDLDLDRPVVRDLPWFRLADRSASDRITVRQLLTHTSGISGPDGLRLADRFDNHDDAVQRAVRDLSDVEPVSGPGEGYRYSDANYLVLGALVAEVSGTSYAEHLRTAVLEPLEMTDAVVDEEGARLRLPPGHRLAFGGARRFDTAYDGSGLPYGYLGASAADLGGFASDQLRAARGGRSRVLAGDSVARMQTGQVTTSSAQYGLGWFTDERDGERMVWHSGATPGYSGTVLLVPERDRAVVLLQNAYAPAHDAQLARAAFDVARILTGREPRPVGADPVLALAPWALLATAAGLLVLLTLSVLRRRRTRRTRVRLDTAGGAGAVLLAVAVGWWLPRSQGADLRRALLWTPDVAVGILAVLLACAGVVAVMSVRLVRARVPSRSGPVSGAAGRQAP